MPCTADQMDLPLSALLGEEARVAGIRPSVLNSDFFREYSLTRLLENPEDAYYSLFHTRGIGATMRLRIVDVIAAKLQAIWPEPWVLAAAEPETGIADETGAEDGPDARLRGFVRHWLTQAERHPRPRLRQKRS
ncbi:hypothetical protein [Roseicyclus marinus]|uniref:hypothetical protein n=1 Tax=Roseicyclus marinus TaxID=2161673 RepID=UPI002410AEA1|nr:hypothetical protein [Roseicyclus marinus]MDG3041857.1 hypothetical protein [Roseicyclus marinus]